MNLDLRDYQIKAIRLTFAALAARQHAGLWVMPTGCGKTRTFIYFAKLLDVPTLILVHRDELIQQTVATVGEHWPGAGVGVVQGKLDEWDGPKVVVASVQSMNEKRLARIPADRYGLVICDEAHHVCAPSWARAVNNFTSGFVLGVTATPDRLDGRGLAEFFGPRPVFVYTLAEAIRGGYLVDLAQYQIRTETDLDAVGVRAGDFAEGELSQAVNTESRNRTVADAYLEHAAGRRAIVFAVDLSHVEALAGAFRERGIPTVTISGGDRTEDRREKLRAFASGEYRVAVNCQVLTEGFDDPDIDCVIMARPTKSRALYVQCVGRGLRLPKRNLGKTNCLVLDITDNCRRHRLVTAVDLETKEKAAGDGERPGPGGPKKWPDDSVAPAVVSWRLESVCPWPQLPSLDDYAGRFAWQKQPASDKQLGVLKRFGLDLRGPITKGEASHLIDQCVAYEEAYPTPATSRQEYALRYAGLWEDGMSKREASRLLADLYRDREAG